MNGFGAIEVVGLKGTDPLLAGLLSAAIPGGGQLYAGMWRFAIVVWVVLQGWLFILGFGLAPNPAIPPWIKLAGLVVWLPAWGVNIWHAVAVARRNRIGDDPGAQRSPVEASRHDRVLLALTVVVTATVYFYVWAFRLTRGAAEAKRAYRGFLMLFPAGAVLATLFAAVGVKTAVEGGSIGSAVWAGLGIGLSGQVAGAYFLIKSIRAALSSRGLRDPLAFGIRFADFVVAAIPFLGGYWMVFFAFRVARLWPESATRHLFASAHGTAA